MINRGRKNNGAKESESVDFEIILVGKKIAMNKEAIF